MVSAPEPLGLIVAGAEFGAAWSGARDARFLFLHGFRSPLINWADMGLGWNGFQGRSGKPPARKRAGLLWNQRY